MSGTSPTLLLVLRGLGRTDGRALLKLAVKELVARDVLRVETEERRRRGRSRGPRLLLVDGPASAPPSRALQVALRHVEAAPSAVRDGRVARELTVVAKHLARGGARREVPAAAVLDLTGMGLVREEERRVLGLFRRRVVVRTPGGDELLRKDERRRTGRGEGGPSDPVMVGFVADPGSAAHPVPGLDERSDAALDGGFDGLFDGAFDSSFDAAFDPSFDAAFDSGFSDGGGGGGGDGGGGGGGGDGGGGGGG